MRDKKNSLVYLTNLLIDMDMSRDHSEVSDKIASLLTKNIDNQLFGLVAKYRDYLATSVTPGTYRLADYLVAQITSSFVTQMTTVDVVSLSTDDGIMDSSLLSFQ